MIIKELSLYNFRNIESEKLELCPNINIFYGQNGAGKTNAVEAIYFLAAAKGFRSKNDAELISFGSDNAAFKASFSTTKKDENIKVNLSRSRKKELYINGVKIEKMREFIGEFRAVLFTPEHLELIKGGPRERRSFMDSALCQTRQEYLSSLYLYAKVHEQRNASIRYQAKNGRNDALIDVYDAKLAETGTRIIIERRRFLKRISQKAAMFYDEISDERERFSLKYQNFVPDSIEEPEKIKNYYLSVLRENRDSDLKYTQTSSGIHKDEIIIYLNAKEARLFSSQGQQRSAVLAMKLAEGELSRDETGEYPVFLFDDILSELDKKRQKYIIEKIKDRQVIITSCSLNGLRLKTDVKFFSVKAGAFSEKKQTGA